MKKKKKTAAVISLAVGGLAAAGVLAAAGAAAGIWKVNQKINTLSNTVEELRSTQLTDVEAIQSYLLNYDQTAYIPKLTPYKDGWQVTQFGDALQSQELCYTITTEKGLIIVDGGWAYEEPRLREIIAQYGNTVEAWILTHPHEDHITAFLDIYEDPQGIQINHVYTVEMPDMETLQANASWDDYSMLERFLALDIPELTYLYTGDEIEILGLKLEVLSAYCDEIDQLSNDLMNDGSLVFRISGQRDSMIFCGDFGSAGNEQSRANMTKYLTEKYGEDLKADYIQMAHHGFGGPTAEFYDLVAPEAAFFDAPYWLMNGSSEDLNTIENQELMRSMGTIIYTYYTAPNWIILE